MEAIKQPKMIEIRGVQFEIDPDGFVMLGDASQELLQIQSQYGARYADDGHTEYQNFGKGLAIKGNSAQYFSMKIHGDDVEKFVDMVNAHRQKR